MAKLILTGSESRIKQIRRELKYRRGIDFEFVEDEVVKPEPKKKRRTTKEEKNI